MFSCIRWQMYEKWMFEQKNVNITFYGYKSRNVLPHKESFVQWNPITMGPTQHAAFYVGKGALNMSFKSSPSPPKRNLALENLKWKKDYHKHLHLPFCSKTSYISHPFSLKISKSYIYMLSFTFLSLACLLV